MPLFLLDFSHASFLSGRLDAEQREAVIEWVYAQQVLPDDTSNGNQLVANKQTDSECPFCSGTVWISTRT